MAVTSEFSDLEREDIAGYSMVKLDLHNKLPKGRLVEVHLDNGEVIRLARTDRTVSYTGQRGVTRELFLSSSVRVLGFVPWEVRTVVAIGQPFFAGEPDDKLVVSAIVVLGRS